MLRKILLCTTLLLTPLLTSAHIPYLDTYNLYNSYSSAFKFPDNVQSRALCTTTRCPPVYFLPPSNSTNSTGNGFKRPRWSGQSWSKVYLSAGENLHFEFGVPHIPALEFPSFRPTVYLLSKCPPSPHAFGHPEPQYLEYPNNQLDISRRYRLKGLRFQLSDPGWQGRRFYERRIGATFLRYLNYRVPVECSGDVYIVVDGGSERRIAEFYVAVGTREGPIGGDTQGVAGETEIKAWANGEEPGIGTYCQRRGIWEKE
ncbi:hypothetical protein TWF481_007831 [Arthrobotrys musiformis]|uniref:Uncharacterized protein n=1 Tax=Arthrobotrys musiformis TaxID=47236 RepID=A0AAV9W7B1_9PEZI